MIKKAVIPAAGFGTRFLPATKAMPKEMLPVVDIPAIQFVVQEAVDSGIEDILIIIGRGKQAIVNHFDRTYELEGQLEKSGKIRQLRQLREISDMADIHFIRQKELKGLGDAVYHARFHVGDEPFIVLLGDVIIDASIPCTRQLIDVYSRFGSPVINVQKIEGEAITHYGVVGGEEIEPGILKLDDLVEKPPIDDLPSRYAIASRYVLTPDIFDYIERTPEGKGNEVQLTDALKLQLQEGKEMYAYRFTGERYDIGNKLEYLKTVVSYGLQRRDIGREFAEYIQGLEKMGL